jgi:hypothetical protein
MTRKKAMVILALVIPGLAAAPTAAENGRFALGLRVNVVAADGKPANDIPGAGLFGHYRLSDRWSLGFALDHSPKFDVERPYEFLGLAGDPEAGEIDADGTSTAVSGWIERVYGRPERRTEWFWGVGGGVVAVDVDDVEGPLADGGSYAITEDVGTELVASARAGLRLRFRRWDAEASLGLDQHFTDWTVRDRVSGRTTSLDDYQVTGIRLGARYRF